MQIIDFDKKGNLVRFYLGNASKPYWGDDWDDAPYDCNAGTVYDEYIKGHKDVVFPFDDLVLEPCNGSYITHISKQDMQQRVVPCIIVVPPEKWKNTWRESFWDWVGAEGIQKFYFGDEMEADKVYES